MIVITKKKYIETITVQKLEEVKSVGRRDGEIERQESEKEHDSREKQANE